MPYLLDTDTFITPKNLYYSFDICSGYWDWLLRAHSEGKVFSVAKVRDELTVGNDDLAEWIGNLPPNFFLPLDADAVTALKTVSQWTVGTDYTPAAISDFLRSADYYLISYALAHNHTVVTLEVTSEGKRRIKIPNVCAELGIECITPFQMLTQESARFILMPKDA